MTIPNASITMIFANPGQTSADAVARIAAIDLTHELADMGLDSSPRAYTDVTTAPTPDTVQRAITANFLIGGLAAEMTADDIITWLEDGLRNVIPMRAPCKLNVIAATLGGFVV
jgi:hypothetical protein